jgi:hypothetical protein
MSQAQQQQLPTTAAEAVERKAKRQMWLRARGAVRSLPWFRMAKWGAAAAVVWAFPWVCFGLVAAWFSARYFFVDPAWRKLGRDAGTLRATSAVESLRDCFRTADEAAQEDEFAARERNVDEALLSAAARGSDPRRQQGEL